LRFPTFEKLIRTGYTGKEFKSEYGEVKLKTRVAKVKMHEGASNLIDAHMHTSMQDFFNEGIAIIL
jgi:hypothetical protein